MNWISHSVEQVEEDIDVKTSNERYYDDYEEENLGRYHRRNRDCDDDFDFCEDKHECKPTCPNQNCECDQDHLCGGRSGGKGRCRENECECHQEKECCCHSCHEDSCCGHDDCSKDCYDECCDYNHDCCEETIHCSHCADFNEDEKLGCQRRVDAANSEENWFETRTQHCHHRERCLSEAECRFCKRLKCRIQVLEFALQEVILYLNTHPCDCEALRYYRQIRRKLERLECLYERKCGPLSNKGVDTEYGWEWATCPWPWEGEI